MYGCVVVCSYVWLYGCMVVCVYACMYVMEDHLSDQATAGDGPEAARGRPRRSSRADLKDPALTIQPEMVLRSNFPFRTFICV